MVSGINGRFIGADCFFLHQHKSDSDSFFISTKAIPSLILRIIVYMVAGIFGSYLAGKYLPVADSSFLQFLFNLLGTSVVLLIVAAFFRVLRGK